MNRMKQKISVFAVVACILLSVTLLFTSGIGVKKASAADDSIFRFSLINSSTEYNVALLDKTVESVIIPSTYNGLPVTEIAANGFLSSTNLKRVYIPENIKKINSSAFMNCAKLKGVYMAGVVEIGQNAFAMCPKLDDMVFPRTIQKVGATILRNNTNTIYLRMEQEATASWTSTWLSSFNGNIEYDYQEIAYETIEKDGVAVGYGIQPFQNLPEEAKDLNVIIDYHEGVNGRLPVLNIGWGAFWECTLQSLTVAASDHATNIESFAFACSNINQIILGNSVTFNDETTEGDYPEDKGTSTSLFIDSTVQRIFLPDNMTQIYAFMFQGCTNLEYISPINSYRDGQSHLPAGITRISEQAFLYCRSLTSLYIPSTVTEVGQNIFTAWSNSQIVEFGFTKLPNEWNQINWNGGNQKLEFLPLSITFNGNNGNPSDVYARKALYGTTLSDMADVPAPAKKGHTFIGWFKDAACTIEFNGAFTDDTTLYAGWEITRYSVEFVENVYLQFNTVPGIIDNDGKVLEGSTIYFVVTVNENYNQSTPTIRVNGAVVQPLGGFYIISNITDNLQITADAMPANEYTITYILNGGTNHAGNVLNYRAGNIISLKDATREGYRFDGWYANSSFSGNKITSFGPNETGHKTFYAKWATNDYYIFYNLNGGVNHPDNPNIYSTENNITLQDATRRGYEFKGWHNENGSKVAVIFKGTAGDIKLYAQWAIINYNIHYYLSGGANDDRNPNYYTVNDMVTLQNPTRMAFNFGGWYTNSSFTNSKVTTFGSNEIGNKTFYAKWIAIDYSITYVLNGGANNPNNPSKYIITDTVTLFKPTRTGYIFEGWYENYLFASNVVEGFGPSVTGNKTFYAKWVAIEYGITYVLNDGTNNPNNPSKYIITDTVTLLGATRTEYNFDGWYANSSFTGSKVIGFGPNEIGNKTFYAKWSIMGNNSNFAGGLGTQDSPYLISTVTQLTYLANQVNAVSNWSRGLYFVLTSNIILNNTANWQNWGNYSTEAEALKAGVQSWTPIGNGWNPFSGYFNGNGFVIKGIYINNNSNCQGLFGVVNGGTINNVGIEESYIKGQNSVGSIAGWIENGSIIVNCYNKGMVRAGLDAAGGIVGSMGASMVINNYNTGSVTGGQYDVGGIVGKMQGSTLINNYNAGSINSNSVYSGGIVGWRVGTNMVEYNYFLQTATINSNKNCAGSVLESPVNNRIFGTNYNLPTSITVGGTARTTLLSALNAGVDTIGLLPVLPSGITYLHWAGTAPTLI